MTDSAFTARSLFPCTADELYTWHSRPGALERLIPPWEKTRVIAREGGIEPGGRVTMRMYAGPVPYNWHARHVMNTPGVVFQDIQERGPFARWTHTHCFTDTEEGALLEDRIDYALRGSFLLPASAGKLVNRTLERIFRYRHDTLRSDIELHNRLRTQPLRILISGASGVLGSALRPLLTTGGHDVWTLVRRPPDRSKQEIHWDPPSGHLNLTDLPPFDSIIHLAGDNIGGGRWTAAKKRKIIESRVQGTGLIARTIARLPVPPRVFLTASAVGFYGNCLDCCMREEDQAGDDFISDVCGLWEQAARPAEDRGIRTVVMRIGVVLTPRGGALQRLLSTAPVGFPRRFGDGRQFISWIGINDMISVILHALCTPSLHGPVNIASPHPVTNSELLQTLARVLHRPLLPPIPAGVLRTMLGQMAEEVLLGGCRVATDKLQQSGYHFRHDDLEQTLRHLLGRST
ncbi:MAG: TIGR01777 family protein [Desulfobulbus sp.]|nr:TIGR01777 family protein [Desulfobulbus sp.]